MLRTVLLFLYAVSVSIATAASREIYTADGGTGVLVISATADGSILVEHGALLSADSMQTRLEVLEKPGVRFIKASFYDGDKPTGTSYGAFGSAI